MATQQVKNILSGHPIWGHQGLHNGPILRPVQQQRIVLCGWPGSGKSTWLLSVPRLLILDCERGSEELPTVHDSTFRKSITRWEDWVAVWKALKDDAANGDRRMFDWVGFDTFDAFAGGQTSIAAEYVMRDSKADVVAAFGANGSGWAQLKELGARAVVELESCGYGWIAATHVRRKQIQLENGSTTSRVSRDLTPGIDAFLSNRASYIGVLSKSVEQREIRKSTTIQGKLIETGTGQYQQMPVFTLAFSSTPNGIEELCKARILSGLEYNFGPTDGFSQFEAAYNKAKAEIEGKTTAKQAA